MSLPAYTHNPAEQPRMQEAGNQRVIIVLSPVLAQHLDLNEHHDDFHIEKLML